MKAPRKKKKNGKKEKKSRNTDDIDDVAIDNFILRIKLPQAVKVLFPVSVFVVTNHACK